MIAKFLRGFLDGSLSTMGIVIGASSGSSTIIVAAAVGGTLANGFSNTLSAFSAAGAEEYGSLRNTERAMVTGDLKNTEAERGISRRSLGAATVDGAGTLLGGGLPVLPYMFVAPDQALLIAVGLILVSSAIVGVYMGRLSRRNFIVSGIKMAVMAGAISAAVYLVQLLVVPEGTSV